MKYFKTIYIAAILSLIAISCGGAGDSASKEEIAANIENLEKPGDPLDPETKSLIRELSSSKAIPKYTKTTQFWYTLRVKNPDRLEKVMEFAAGKDTLKYPNLKIPLMVLDQRKN